MSKRPKKASRKNNTSSKASARASSRGGEPMNVALLEQIVNLMAANDLNTVDVRDGDKRVILKRGAVAQTVIAGGGNPAFYTGAAMAPASSAPASTTGTAAGAAGGAAAEDSNLVAIKSPMVGTFYAAATPDAKPFVSVGTRVDEETDVCIIEAMKVFNNIKAEISGTIERVLVNNGETVEFGQTLFLVKP